MGLLKKVNNWFDDSLLDYISVNPTRDEVTHYKVDPDIESDQAIMKVRTVKEFDSITCLDFSEAVPGLIGVGGKNGYVRFLNILDESQTEMDGLSSDLSLKSDYRVRAKKQRSVRTLGINANGLIAVGLEKSRNDPSLQIWDMNYHNIESSVINPTFGYCTNESILSLKFLDETSILASSSKFLKELDVRSPNPIYQHPTRLSFDIKINPFNQWQFSTYGDDGTLALWDRRKLSYRTDSHDITSIGPVLTFDKLMGTGASSRKYMDSCFRWSIVRSNEFSTLYGGNTIKRWQLGSHSYDAGENFIEDNLFVSMVHDINTPFDKVVTFDYIPRKTARTSFVCMRQSGTVYRMSTEESITLAKFDCRNTLLLSDMEVPIMNEIRITQEHNHVNPENAEKSLRELSFEDLDVGDDDIPSSQSSNISNNEVDFEEPAISNSSNVDNGFPTDYHVSWKPQQLLDKDISIIMRKRAMLGYGLDPMATVDMVDDFKSFQNYSYIKNTWRWIAIAKASVDDASMVSDDLDLGYEGVLGIWSGLDGISNQARYRKGSIMTDKQLIKEMEKIIELRRRNKMDPQYSNSLRKNADTSKSVQRKFCQIISGWDLSPKDYEEKYRIITNKGNFVKAAAWAVFFGDIPRAVDILASAKSERLKLIATAIAGYMAYKDQPGNNSWRQQCRKMAAELDDPYLRVTFAFIADNDWWDVLYEEAISLRERLGVALRFLPDADLTRFLERTTLAVIEKGELEGLILTGITPRGIDLLQSYVNKTGDVQSAALVSIFGSPRYFKDSRVMEWVQTYRAMLNSWELFAMRAKFDIVRSKLSRTSTGVQTLEVKPRQLYLQCTNCKKNINSPRSEASQQGKYPQNDKPRHKYACPHCGASLPRCAICLMPLGTANLPFVIEGTQPVTNEDMGNTQRRLRLNEWFSICLMCNHGMHAGHAEEWFERHPVCPTPGCKCRCKS